MKKRIFASILAMLLLLGGCGAGDSSANSSQGGASNSSEISGENSSSEDVGSTSEDSSSTGEDSSSGGVEEACVDSDDNGVCDDCKESVLVTLDIFAVNDLHGKVLDNSEQEGVDELSTYLKNAKAQNEYTFTLSSGDMWQGTAESGLTYGNLVTEWMNEMDFVSMTMGNHEFDWGEEYIEDNAELAKFPFLGINVFDRSTNKRVDYCDASVMVEISGLKVGVIGAIGDCYSSISSDKVEDVYFKTGAQLTALVKAESQALKARGADCIVYSVHDGYDNYDAVLSNGYVDVVFEGHTHQSYVYTDSYGVYHLQGGGDNDGITHAKLTVNFARNEADTAQAKTVRVSQYKHLADDPVVNEVAERYGDEVALARKQLGKNDSRRYSSELCNLVAKLYVKAGLEKWGDEYDIVLGGGFINARSPYELAAGTIAYGDVYNIFPFNNPLVLCSVRGSTLKSQFLENSRYRIYCSEYGESVRNSIVDSQTYYIVIDTYSSLYAPNGATEIARYDETTYARDLLADYIEDGGFTTQTDDSTDSSTDEPTTGITLTSISEALTIGNALGAGEKTSTYYYVKGTIKETPNATYGNCTIVDADGNELWVYGIIDTDENYYGNADFNGDKPQKGDTVILHGRIMRYVNASEDKVELYQAVFIQKVNE